MEIRMIKKADQPVGTWAGGTTTQLAIWPEGADYASRKFEWRLSSARVDLDESNFTPLPDFHRILMILDGKIHLIHELAVCDGITRVQELDLTPFEPTEFEGAWHTKSLGRCVDFNLMTNISSPWRGTVTAVFGSQDAKVIELAGAFEAFYCLYDGVKAKITNQSQVQDVTLDKGDFLLINLFDQNKLNNNKASLTLFGSGEILGVRVTLKNYGEA